MNDNDVKILLKRKTDLKKEIEHIKTNYEGISNEDNLEKLEELNIELNDLMKGKTNLLNKLGAVDFQLRKTNQKIRNLSGDGMEKILDGIEKQRWFFLKNKPKVIFDKYTGILWANLDYFDFYNKDSSSHTYSYEEATNIVDDLDLDGLNNWAIPTSFQMICMIEDKSFPFQEGNCHRIKNLDYWFATDGADYCIDMDNYNMGQANVYLLPCNTALATEEYERNVMEENRVYTLTEKLQFTLDIFTNNELIPIFEDEEADEYFQKIFVEKNKLLEEYGEISTEMAKIENQIKLSSVFDYKILLENYDLEDIDKSAFKYYEACKIWMNKLSSMLEYFDFENKEESTVVLPKKIEYEYSFELTEEENHMLKSRTDFFNNKLSISTGDIRLKFSRFENQINNFYKRVEEANNSDNPFEKLAELEKQDRVTFEFFAENTNNIVKVLFDKKEKSKVDEEKFNSLLKIEKNWSTDYIRLKTSYKEKYKNICERADIASFVWSIWFREWTIKRKQIEDIILTLMEKELGDGFAECSSISEIEDTCITEKLMDVLQIYKDNIDDFYTNRRKGIYDEYASITNGDLQENVAVSKEMIRFSAFLKGNVENIVNEIDNSEDKVFIQKWLKPIIEIKVR